MHSNYVISLCQDCVPFSLPCLIVATQSHVYERRRYGMQTVRTSELCKCANYCSLVVQNILFCRLHYEFLLV